MRALALARRAGYDAKVCSRHCIRRRAICDKNHIAIVTDAWEPQMNGVVRVLKDRKRVLEKMGYRVSMVTAEDFYTIPFRPYPEIKLAVFARGQMQLRNPTVRLSASVGEKLAELKPGYIHIATAAEGTLGPAAVKFCKRNAISYTTEMHSRFPEYVAAYVAKVAGRHSKPLTARLTYAWVRSCHEGAHRTLVPSRSMMEEFGAHRLGNLVVCPHGVDTELFRPGHSDVYSAYARPVFLYVGRVAVEKGIDRFLALDLPGTRVVVGDGPERKLLEKKFSATGVKFPGKKSGADLVAHYQGADVVVFPSVTDTFGNVNVEALACGKPVAGFPASGIKDIITHPSLGALDGDLRAACLQALALSERNETASACRAHAVSHYDWSVAVDNFLGNLVEVGAPNASRPGTAPIWGSVPGRPLTAA